MPGRMKLTEIDIFEALSSPEYAPFLQKFRELKFAKKETVYTPHHEENSVFLVKEGRIRVFLAYEDKEFTLSILESGDIYSSHTRAYCQALEDSTLLVTGVQHFREFLMKFPDFSQVMVKVLGDSLQNSINIIEGLVFQEANQRIASFIVNAAKDMGVSTAEGIRITLGLTVEDLAAMVGTTRQTTSVFLNTLMREEILSKENRKTLLIKNIEKLKKYLD